MAACWWAPRSHSGPICSGLPCARFRCSTWCAITCSAAARPGSKSTARPSRRPSSRRSTPTRPITTSSRAPAIRRCSCCRPTATTGSTPCTRASSPPRCRGPRRAARCFCASSAIPATAAPTWSSRRSSSSPTNTRLRSLRWGSTRGRGWGRGQPRRPESVNEVLSDLALEPELHQLWIELHTGLLLEDGAALLDRERLLVGAIGRHRIERVGDAHDARDQRDLLARQAIRIALAVPALVMVADAGHGRLQHLDLRGDSVADHRVDAHVLPLL